MNNTGTGSEMREFKYGWPVVLAAAVGIGLGMSPLPFYTIGVFVGPYIQEFGWRVDQIMLAFSFFSVAALVAAPLTGIVTDKFGARRTALVSIGTFSLMMMAMALNNGSMILYLSLWVMLAIFGCGTLPITFTKVVNRWFNKKRGLALGLSLLGTGFFGAMAKLYANEIIEMYGWRAAYIGLGFLPLVIAFPIVYFFLRDPTDPKLQDKVGRMKQDPELDKDQVSQIPGGMTLAQAFKDYRFWLLAISFVPISFAISGPIPNLEKILDTKGFSVNDAVIIASVIGYSVIIGRLLGGYLIDKFWAPGVAAVIFLLPIVSCLLFQQDNITYTMATLAVAIIGFCAGVEYDLMAFLVTKYFGMKNYAAIYGTLYGFFAIGAGFGPWLFGKSFALTGSYSTIFGYAIILFIAGALPLVLLGKYREFAPEEPLIS